MSELKKLVLNGREYTFTDPGAARAEAVGDIQTALDSILAIQNSLMGGDGA